MELTFSGWSPEALTFYSALSADNSKAFWLAHKDVYLEAVATPFEALASELDDEFGPFKVFRPNRDVRFSKDKSPYKTQAAMASGRNGYVQLSASGLATGTGVYQFDRDQLARYRDAVAHPLWGPELVEILAAIESAGHTTFVSERLKGVPRGFEADHPRARELAYKGLVAWHEWGDPEWLYTPAAREQVTTFFHETMPLHKWLAARVGPAGPRLVRPATTTA